MSFLSLRVSEQADIYLSPGSEALLLSEPKPVVCRAPLLQHPGPKRAHGVPPCVTRHGLPAGSMSVPHRMASPDHAPGQESTPRKSPDCADMATGPGYLAGNDVTHEATGSIRAYLMAPLCTARRLVQEHGQAFHPMEPGSVGLGVVEPIDIHPACALRYFTHVDVRKLALADRHHASALARQ